jgi:hypothetical protein
MLDKMRTSSLRMHTMRGKFCREKFAEQAKFAA